MLRVVSTATATQEGAAELPRVGQRFRLKRTTIATVMQDGKRIAVQIPADATIIAIDPVPECKSDDRSQQVNVQWQGKDLMMFVIDIQERGERIQTAAEK